MESNILYKKLETENEIKMSKYLIMEYIKWINLDLSFQDIDKELNDFPEKYIEPNGLFIIAKDEDNVIGCVGLKKWMKKFVK